MPPPFLATVSVSSRCPTETSKSFHTTPLLTGFPLIDVRPMDFFPSGSELVPLRPYMSNIEDIVEYLVESQFQSWTFDTFLEMW